MKDWHSLEGAAQSEALLNEIKGNLFEYMTAHHLSRLLLLEKEFICEFQKSGEGRFQSDLVGYQQWVRSHDLELYKALPILSQKTAEGLLKELGPSPKVKNVFVTGKAGAVSGQEHYKEADILILFGDKSILPVSLKLCKKGAFVNTKSGGIKSFYIKYFSSFSDANERQRNLNQFVDTSFQEMAEGLYQWSDISEEIATHPVEATQFSSLWVEKGFPELPGELPIEAKAILHTHYQRVIARVHSDLSAFYQEDSDQFTNGLYSILGLGLPNMLQVSCFHSGTKGHQLSSLQVHKRESFEMGVNTFQLEELNLKVSSFAIRMGKNILQVRVKPMNKFTVSALKVNCSLKDSG